MGNHANLKNAFQDLAVKIHLECQDKDILILSRRDRKIKNVPAQLILPIYVQESLLWTKLETPELPVIDISVPHGSWIVHDDLACIAVSFVGWPIFRQDFLCYLHETRAKDMNNALNYSRLKNIRRNVEQIWVKWFLNSFSFHKSYRNPNPAQYALERKWGFVINNNAVV